jgi:predicted secreted protein
MIVKFTTHFLVCLLVFICSCSLPQLNKEAPEINTVEKNKKFRINLPENHNTGYLWQLSTGFDQTVAEELNAVWHGNEKGIDFNFKAGESGQTTFTFVLRKHTDTSNVKSFIVKIIDQ